MNLSNLFNWFKKKYTYNTWCYQCEFRVVNEITRNFLGENPQIIPVNISVCPSGVSGTAYVAILYKIEKK